MEAGILALLTMRLSSHFISPGFTSSSKTRITFAINSTELQQPFRVLGQCANCQLAANRPTWQWMQTDPRWQWMPFKVNGMHVFQRSSPIQPHFSSKQLDFSFFCVLFLPKNSTTGEFIWFSASPYTWACYKEIGVTWFLKILIV